MRLRAGCLFVTYTVHILKMLKIAKVWMRRKIENKSFLVT